MTLTTASSALEARFDPFLYARIRDDPEDTPVTVLSALARLDVDPWEEAARLAQLSSEVATEVLAGWIAAALPEGSAAHRDSRTIAARLVSLLPSRASRKIAPPRTPPGTPQVIIRPRIITQAILCLIVLALPFAIQWVTTHRQATGRPSSSLMTAAKSVSTRKPKPVAPNSIVVPKAPERTRAAGTALAHPRGER